MMKLDCIERVVYNTPNTDDVLNLVKHAKISQVLEAERKMAFIRALEDAEERINNFKGITKYSWLKSLILAMIGGVIGVYFKTGVIAIFEKFLTHKILAPVLIGLLGGYTLNNTLDLGIFTFFFPKNFSTRECKVLLIDFFSALNLGSNEEEGYYATPTEIANIIYDSRGNRYEDWEVLEFLQKQPYKKQDVSKEKYLITAEIQR